MEQRVCVLACLFYMQAEQEKATISPQAGDKPYLRPAEEKAPVL